MQELSLYEDAKKSVALLTEIDDVKDKLDKSQAVAEYMKRAGDTELATKAAKYSIYCQRQAGILLTGMEKNKGAEGNQSNQHSREVQSTNTTTPKTLSEIGITKDQSSQFQKLASIDENKFDEVVENQIDNGAIPNRSKTLKLASGDHNIATKHTGNNEWYTPSEYIESARSVMGSIQLDPASNEIAQETVKADEFYTINDDGLNYDWTGKNIWLNPPYSSSEIKQFIEKITDTDINQAVILTNNSTDTTWFKKLSEWCDLICFTGGRISFYSKDGQKTSPTNGQAFFYKGSQEDAFIQEFKQHGLIMRLCSE